MKEETTNQENLLCPKAGTATSSPSELTSSQCELNVPNLMIWMQRNANEESTAQKNRPSIERKPTRSLGLVTCTLYQQSFR